MRSPNTHRVLNEVGDMRIRRARLFVALLLVVSAGFSGAVSVRAQSLPAPEEFLGFKVGMDKKLARWEQVVDYMQRAYKVSDRVRFTELGKSTMGNPFIMLAISSPANLARLEEIRANQAKL